MVKERKKRIRKPRSYKDWRVILDLPERLAEPLRLLFQIEKSTWDFCLDKIRQEKKLEAEWRAKDEEHETKVYKCSIVYKEWKKSKGAGKGFRHFAAPCDELKSIQRSILHRFLSQIPVHFCRHAAKGSSIMTNARHHEGAYAVYSVDLVNAFPTVFRSRILANLNKPFNYALRQLSGLKFSSEDREMMLEAVADLLSLHDRLPQGPPTSPSILNLVCMKMDKEIFGLLQASSTAFQSYRYTAYADDLTISSDGEIPKELREAILKIIKDNGFIAHSRADKSKYFSPSIGELPVVTGLVINPDGRLTMAPRKVDQLRATLYQLHQIEDWDEHDVGKAAGTIGYIKSVYEGRQPPSKLRKLVVATEARLQLSSVSKMAEIIELETGYQPDTEVKTPSKVERLISSVGTWLRRVSSIAGSVPTDEQTDSKIKKPSRSKGKKKPKELVA